SLRGSSRQIGAEALADLCQALEGGAPQMNWPELECQAKQAEACFAEVRSAMSEYVQRATRVVDSCLFGGRHSLFGSPVVVSWAPQGVSRPSATSTIDLRPRGRLPTISSRQPGNGMIMTQMGQFTMEDSADREPFSENEISQLRVTTTVRLCNLPLF